MRGGDSGRQGNGGGVAIGQGQLGGDAPGGELKLLQRPTNVKPV